MLGEIRDQERIRQVIKECGPTLIVVEAASKQVDTCELSPGRNIKTNVIGVTNVLNVCSNFETSVSQHKAITIASTYKACPPTNIYGMSRVITERRFVSQSRREKLKF